MIDTKNQALLKIKETIDLLDKAQFNLGRVGACWEKLDEDDIERTNCRDFSIKISRIIEHLKLI
ncbi:MAG: hypothetical protein KF732_03100 [Flavobacteriales bacterium]|nr:hypothetical protein [Flavobacteriales bacterium]MBX2958922.1 hypothetical protein [Flavobacteriales bacterium]MCZ2223189.1 hypothetical protein [Chitinophagales bacterium]